jgi:hypothetical protein
MVVVVVAVGEISGRQEQWCQSYCFFCHKHKANKANKANKQTNKAEHRERKARPPTFGNGYWFIQIFIRSRSYPPVLTDALVRWQNLSEVSDSE